MEDLIEGLVAAGSAYIVVIIVYFLVSIGILFWVSADFKNRDGTGCGSCIWILVILHFNFIGLLA